MKIIATGVLLENQWNFSSYYGLFAINKLAYKHNFVVANGIMSIANKDIYPIMRKTGGKFIR